MNQDTSIPERVGRGGLSTKDLEVFIEKPHKGFPMWLVPTIIAGVLLVAVVILGINLFNMQDGLNQTNDSISNINKNIQAISSQLTLVALQPSPIPTFAPTPSVDTGKGVDQGQPSTAVWMIKITTPENLQAGGTATITLEVSQDSKPAANSAVSLTFNGVAAPKVEQVLPPGPYKTDANGKLEVSFPLLTIGDFTLIAKAGEKEESANFTVVASPDSDGDGVSDALERSALYNTNPNFSDSYKITSTVAMVKFRSLYKPDDAIGTIATGFSVFGFEHLQQTTDKTLTVREVEFTALYKPGAGYSKDQPLTLKAGEQFYDPLKADQVVFKISLDQPCTNSGATFDPSNKPFCEITGSQGDFLMVKIRGTIGDQVLKPVGGLVTPSSTPTTPVGTATPTPGENPTGTPTLAPTSSNMTPTETPTKTNG